MSSQEHGGHHVQSVGLLAGIFAALIVLTIATVAAIKIDLGPNLNLVVAMVIATIKAALVVMFFMHLWYDRGFNLVFFLSSLMALTLFIVFLIMDSGQYQGDVKWPDPVVAEE